MDLKKQPDSDDTVDLVELFGLTPAADLYQAQLAEFRTWADRSAASAEGAADASKRALAAVKRTRALAAEMAEEQRKQTEASRVTLACTAVVAACVIAQTILAAMHWMG